MVKNGRKLHLSPFDKQHLTVSSHGSYVNRASLWTEMACASNQRGSPWTGLAAGRAQWASIKKCEI